jgi:NAD(P)-dependent dehydrogenase (short-subunit alcohol dehydrogenase family)
MEESQMNMDGKTVLITGASRGIGAAAARVFADAGARVALIARSGDDLAELAGEIGDAAIAIPCDVSRYWEISAAVDATVGTFGSLDVMINNAGVIKPIAHLADSDPDGWGQTIDINLKGVYHGLRAAMPVMIAAGGGTILNISSGAAYRPVEGWSHYCAAKAGAAMLTRCAHEEGRAKGLRVMGLSPGTVGTDMQRKIAASGISEGRKLDWSEHIPPEWPARALLWMCSPDADEFLGEDVRLRDDEVRRRVGLMA